jgi:dTDP-4-dehydrorhamnose reductase
VVRILVLGGSGLLGQYVVREALGRGHEVHATYLSTPCAFAGVPTHQADLADAASLADAFGKAQPEAAVLCAALTGVDYCEDHPEEAARVNAQGPALVADLCRESNARLVHVSTDYVFDGDAGPYDEGADPSPLSVYGRTKHEGEVEVLRRLPTAAVVRLCAVYGWNRVQAKANSVTWILGRLRRGEAVPLFTDQRVSPTYAADAASVLLDLTESHASGVFHATPRDCVTRLELGELVSSVFSLPQDLLRPSTLTEANLKAPRPRHSCLLPRRLEKVLNRRIRPLPEALVHMRDAE